MTCRGPAQFPNRQVTTGTPRRAWLASGLVSLVLCGCASMVAPARNAARAAPVVKVTPPPAEDDLLLQLLSAQFALQDNRLEDGARGFARAARLSPDPDVAAEATHLALATGDWDLADTASARWRALAPQADGLLQAQAWIALGRGDEATAAATLRRMTATADRDAWRRVAQVLLAASDRKAAARLLEALATPERLGSSGSVSVAVSQLAWKLGDQTLAQRLAGSAIKRFHGADGYEWAARLALDQDHPQAARHYYEAALQHHPRDARLRGGYAALLAEGGDNGAAVRVLSEGPQDDTTYAARAAYAARAQDQPALAILYREVEADRSPRTGERYYLMGQVAELLDRHREALDWYADVPDGDEHWFDAQTRASVVLDHQGNTAAALARLHRLRAEVGDDSGQRGDTWLIEADLLIHHDHRQQALAVYGNAIDVLPDDVRLLYARSMLEVDLGNLPGAERDLRRVIDLAPDDAEALNALGYTLADRTGRKEEALALIQKAIKLKPDEPAIIDSMGWVQYRLGHLDAAIKDLRRAFALQSDAEIAAHLGEVLWVSGERGEARRIWEQVRKHEADNKVLLETIRRLTT
jgi:tetratricopeptide (TPR) repeat protein